MKMIRYLSEIDVWKKRSQYLSEVLEIFGVSRDDWLINLFQHEDLGTLSDSFEIIEQRFSKFNHNSWAFIKELSLSTKFIQFLKNIAENDITHLINSVDEHSDTRLIQGGTVTSLIQVKKFLYPFFNKADVTLDTFLKELNNIAIENPSLISKLTLCNSNTMALQNMYNTISKRGEVTKEKIQNAVTIGTYKFVKEEDDENCIFDLSYPSTSEEPEIMTYKINELQDLCSRALLISKPGDSFEQIDDIKDKMEEFITQVDTAQYIIVTMNKLIQLGHFGYRKYNESAKGTGNLKKMANRLRKELDSW